MQLDVRRLNVLGKRPTRKKNAKSYALIPAYVFVHILKSRWNNSTSFPLFCFSVKSDGCLVRLLVGWMAETLSAIQLWLLIFAGFKLYVCCWNMNAMMLLLFIFIFVCFLSSSLNYKHTWLTFWCISWGVPAKHKKKLKKIIIFERWLHRQTWYMFVGSRKECQWGNLKKW